MFDNVRVWELLRVRVCAGWNAGAFGVSVPFGVSLIVFQKSCCLNEKLLKKVAVRARELVEM